MKTKVCIIGTHSVGKTTLSYLVASYYKKLGKSVQLVQEVARRSPFALNEKMSREACLWIYHEHVKKELEASASHEVVISDRSAIDSFVYALVMQCEEDRYSSRCFIAANEWMETYDKIIHIALGNTDPSEDGFRSTDKEFQMKIDTCFKNLISNMDTEEKKKVISITSDDILDPDTVLEKIF